MEVRQEFCNLDKSETGPEWMWDTHLETWMALRSDLDGAEMQISGTWWRWYVTWMVVRCRYQDMGWGETQSWWMAWLEVRQGIDRGAPFIFKPGWRWYVTWIEVIEYQDLDGVETLSGGRCDVTIWTWIGLRQYMYGGETKIFGPGSRWDRTWM